MLEIAKYFCDQIKADNSLSTLTGADKNDSRIYAWNPPFTIVFSDQYKAVILYRVSQNPRPTTYSYPSQRGNEYIYFSVESPNKTLAKQVAEAVINKFENKGFYTTNWKVGNVVMNGNSEGEVGGTGTTPIHKQNISFLLLPVFKRGNYANLI